MSTAEKDDCYNALSNLKLDSGEPSGQFGEGTAHARYVFMHT